MGRPPLRADENVLLLPGPDLTLLAGDSWDTSSVESGA